MGSRARTAISCAHNVPDQRTTSARPACVPPSVILVRRTSSTVPSSAKSPAYISTRRTAFADVSPDSAHLMVECVTPCKDCFGSTVSSCTSCVNYTYVLNDFDCLLACPVGKFNLTGRCDKCYPSCKTCSATASNCVDCADGYYRKGIACLSDCGTGYAPFNGTSCKGMTPTRSSSVRGQVLRLPVRRNNAYLH